VSAARLVPLLKDGDALRADQSLAIIEYLDETHPEPPLLPADPLGRARVRALALDIACEIHPLNNLRVLRYLTHDLKLSEDDKDRWYRHWVETGLETVERQLAAAPAHLLPWRHAHPGRLTCWCRRSSTPSASTAGSTTCRR
jgi:maleylpyruvate isomerase